MAKPIAVFLSIMPNTLKKVLDFGREHRFLTRAGALKNATVCTEILLKVLEIRHNEVYSRILQREGLTLFGLIERALQDYAARHGYFRKR